MSLFPAVRMSFSPVVGMSLCPVSSQAAVLSMIQGLRMAPEVPVLHGSALAAGAWSVSLNDVPCLGSGGLASHLFAAYWDLLYRRQR